MGIFLLSKYSLYAQLLNVEEGELNWYQKMVYKTNNTTK